MMSRWQIPVWGLLAGILAVGIYCLYDQPAEKKNREILPEMAAALPQPQKSSNAARLFSERKKKVKGVNKYDRPDLFADWHRGIRTPEGKREPAYSLNYQIRELLKAKGLRSTRELGKAYARRGSGGFNWNERGPGNVSGRTRGIVIDPADSGHHTWYVGAVGGGVWKTTDAGKSWQEKTVGLTNLAASTLAMAPANPDILYLGTGEGFGNIDQIDGSGIWKSSDRGETWQQLSSTANQIDFQNIMRMIVSPDDSELLLAATAPGFYHLNDRPDSKIFRSRDGGHSWTEVYRASSAIEQLVANPQNFNTQYATINGQGIIKSTDGGTTWREVSFGIGDVQRIEMAISPTDTQRLYFSAESGRDGSVLCISENAGETWQTTREVGKNSDWLSGQGWYDNTIAVHPYDKNIVFVGGIDLWRANILDGGEIVGRIAGIKEDWTTQFLAFLNWGGTHGNGGIDTGRDFYAREVEAQDYSSVEIRFGPGRKQKAHRFVKERSSRETYEYQNYIEVPFEAWDVDRNRQLMVSFRDWNEDGEFDLVHANAENPSPQEYLLINAVEYDPLKADTNIARDEGLRFKNIYRIRPILAEAATVWNPSELPLSKLSILWEKVRIRSITMTPLTDVYGQYGGISRQVHPDQHNILLMPLDTLARTFRMVVGNDGGVTYSDDGGEHFIQTLNGYNTAQFYGVDKMNGQDRYIGGTQDNGSWFSPENPNSATAWKSAPSGDGFQAVWHYGDGNKMLESSQYNGLYRSLDGGTTWRSVGFSNGLRDQGALLAPFFTRIAASKQDPELLFVVGSSGVWRSENFAEHWTLVPINSLGWDGASSFTQIKISLANPQIIWTGKGMTGRNRLYLSTDGGLSFKTVQNYSGGSLGWLSGLATHPIQDSTAFALFSFAGMPRVLKTADLGQTWEDLSGFEGSIVSKNGFPDVAVYSLLVMPTTPDTIWVGTEIGIFESTDGGKHWAYADNGLPPVAVYEMKIVNDEVIVATHGRGVWSVALPELSEYRPLAVTLMPRFKKVAGGAAGRIQIEAALASAYDSSAIVISGKTILKLPANSAAKDTHVVVHLPVERLEEISLALTAYRKGRIYRSAPLNIEVYPLKPPRAYYKSDFNTAEDDFIGDGFSVTVPAGFENGAMHSAHYYPDNSNATALLSVPIRVAENPKIAALSFEEIVLVEIGDPGTVYGDSRFWDYVIVEGSKDHGANWVSLVDGYDARTDEAWLNAYKNGLPGVSAMFRKRTISLLDAFSAGDEIVIRFRLFSDTHLNAWGWAIDNLNIQNILNAAAGDPAAALPETFDLGQNYPNPFNPATTILYQLPVTEQVVITIFDLLGQKVRSLVNQKQVPGRYSIVWDGKNAFGQTVASGMYFYQMKAGRFIQHRKMLLIK